MFYFYSSYTLFYIYLVNQVNILQVKWARMLKIEKLYTFFFVPLIKCNTKLKNLNGCVNRKTFDEVVVKRKKKIKALNFRKT